MAVETGWHQRERGATERIGLAYPYGRELVHAPIPGNNTELAYDPASGIYLPRTISGPRSLSSYSPDVTKRWLNSAGGSYSIFANRRVFTAGTGTRSFFVSKATYSSSGIYHHVTSSGWYKFEHWNGTVSFVDMPLGANDNDEFLITYNGTTLSVVLWSGGGTRYTYSAAINSYGASGAYTEINSADGGQSIGSDYFFVWNRVVTESEIEPLRNNPKAAYRFSPKTVFKFPSAGGGGATVVEKTFSAQWNSIAEIAQQVTAQWNLNTAVEKAGEFQWNTVVSIEQQNTFQWNSFAAVEQTSTLQWNSIAAISQQATLQWSALAEIAQQTTLQWDVQAAAAGPVITNVDLDNSIANGQTNVEINGSGFGTTGTVDIYDEAGNDVFQTGLTWTDTKVTVAVLDAGSINGSCTLRLRKTG